MTDEPGRTEMTDEPGDAYGRAFGALVQDELLPSGDFDLAGPSLRTARTLRRRRRRLAAGGVVVAGVVVLLSAGITVGDRTAQPAAPTVAAATPTPAITNSPAPSSPAPSSPAPSTGGLRPVTVDAGLPDLRTGDAAGVEWVQDRIWHQAGGGMTRLGLPMGADQAVQAFAFDGGLFVTASTAAGQQTNVIVGPDEKSSPVAETGRAFARGPGGSILWLTTVAGAPTIVRLDPGRTFRRYAVALPDIDAASIAVSRDAVFVSDGASVTRYTMTDSELTDPRPVNGATGVVAGDPDANALLVDEDLCTSVVRADDPRPDGWECRYRVMAASADGRYRYGYDLDSEDGVVTDASGRTVMTVRDAGSSQAVFDADNRLRLIGSAPGADDQTTLNAVVVCDVPRACRRVSDELPVAVNSGARPLMLIQ